MLDGLRSTLDTISDDDRKSLNTAYSACTREIDILEKELGDNSLIAEQKMQILTKIDDVVKRISRKDSENRLFGIMKVTALSMGSPLLMLLTLGASTLINNTEESKEKEIDV